MKNHIKIMLLIVISFSLSNCEREGCTDSNAINYDSKATKDNGSCKFEEIVIPNNSDVLGFELLNEIPGIWDGPVTSPTALGSFPLWIVDFRPISAAQVSAKNELNKDNDIFMSFFICKYKKEYKMAFRNGGKFAGNTRSTYMIVDSVKKTNSYSFYRFSDPVSNGNRVYTDITFKGDSLIMHTYTNKFNTLSEPVTHMVWKAIIKDRTSAQNAIDKFNYPKKELVKDFSTTFVDLTDAVFYSLANDPYPEEDHPYLGITNVSINITNPSTIDPNKMIMISITSEPLFNGFVFNINNLKFRSRYVFVKASNPSFSFNYMHPGDYYINTIYDSNGDYLFSSGDYMNSSLDKAIILTEKGVEDVSINIDFLIP